MLQTAFISANNLGKNLHEVPETEFQEAQSDGRPLYELLADVEECKWRREIAAEIRSKQRGIYYKVSNTICL